MQRLQPSGSVPTPWTTHPAAPATPSPRRRETSFSLPRRRDSRNLENELLRRRGWGGHRGRGQSPRLSQAPPPWRKRSPSSPAALRPQPCLSGGLLRTDGGQCGGDTEKSPGGGGQGRGLTQRGRQVFPAEDLFVQLFCLLVLVLFQVGRGLRGGEGLGDLGSDLPPWARCYRRSQTRPPPTSHLVTKGR